MAELRQINYLDRRQFSEPRSAQEMDMDRSNKRSNKRSSYQLETMAEPTNGKIKETCPAIVARNVSKSYKKGVPVLENFNMTVPRGHIYSLLGESSCGKTTTLSCVVGVRKIDEGNIWVFGGRPGEKGKMIGYMPQDTSLYGDFSIGETLSYFGTLCGMDKESVTRGIAFLTELLRLPKSSRRVGTLSGGQRRRVSFAVALIHDPELLILDEPTVGVDPLLRESIWKHLVRLSTERGTTILITTHYIDEAKESSTIGVMRNSRLLVEQSPSYLLERFDTTSLESVVLILCKKDTDEKENDNAKPQFRQSAHQRQLKYDVESPDDSPYTPSPEDNDNSGKFSDLLARMRALIQKNLAVLFRNLLLFAFTLFIPAFIILVMCIAFKDDPKNLPFGIINNEVTNSSFCSAASRPAGECDVENLSCKFMSNIPTDIMNLRQYDTEEDAASAVHAGSIWGYMIFPEDYSGFFYERAASGANVDDDVLNKSEIIVKMDQTSKNIVNKLKKTLHDGFEDYAKAILKDCGFDERQAEFALSYDTPVFGTDDTKFIDFVAPSITIAWLFFFPIIAAAIRYINEKKQGTYERSLAAGTSTWEILVAYALTECFVLALQSLLVYFILTVLIGIELIGSTVLVLILFLMSGFGGVSMGFFIGTLCNEEIEAALLAMALFFPNVFISGIIWPLEGMPLVLQYIAYALPCTLTAESIRSIFSRGWSFLHPNVWPGYVSLFGYTMLYFYLTVIIQKLRST